MEQARRGLQGSQGRMGSGWIVVALGGLVWGGPALWGAEGARPHLTVRVPGGMPAQPVITDLLISNQATTLRWRGFGGPYRVYENLGLTNAWQSMGAATFGEELSFPIRRGNTFYRVSGAPPEYAGAEVCSMCHAATHADLLTTAHTRAYENLPPFAKTNSNCLPCHTVGYGSPTGFRDLQATPHLAGVQCENCHGPAALHAAVDDDPRVRPPRDLSAKVCGGCHTDVHHPTYDEWETSRHVEVTQELVSSFTSTNLAGVTNRLNACGPCHSGAVRQVLLGNLTAPAYRRQPLPSGAEAAAIGITCVTCHEPHKQTAQRAQLRNPTFSTNLVSWNTSVAFANQYDPNLHLCAQCHNARNAQWSDNSRPPHHSAQYNLLLGAIGVTGADFDPRQNISTHWLALTNQCVDCHMPSRSVATPTDAEPNLTGHSFRVVSFEICQQCHLDAESAVEAVQYGIQQRLQSVKAQLDQWATNKAPAALRESYGALAWEYTNPGSLSLLPGVTGRGPTAAEQTNSVPAGIRQARFNLYVVANEGSFGAHNAFYAAHLLSVAEDKVREELGR